MSEWKSVPISEVADCCLGKMLDAKKNKGELRPYLNNVAVRWGSFDLVDLPEMRIEDDEVERYSVVKGDIVMCEGGEPGRCAVWKSEEPVFIQKALHRIRVKNVADPMFVYYQLCHLVRSGETRSLESGSTIRHLPGQALQEVKLSLPSLSVQKRIAAVLSSFDDKIENNHKICMNLEEQAQAIFKSWFVDFEPFGGEMPGEWNRAILSDIAEYDIRRIHKKDLTIKTYFSTENMLPDRGGVEAAASLPETDEVPRCDAGAVLVSNIRPYFKKIHLTSETGGHSADVLCFVAKDPEMKWYLYRLLWDDAFFAYVMSGAKGCKMPRGDKEQIMEYGCVAPDTVAITKFNAVIEPMCRKIAQCENESCALAELRDALLPKLMSGEVDVSKVEVPK